jgi:hypothetical protein
MSESQAIKSEGKQTSIEVLVEVLKKWYDTRKKALEEDMKVYGLSEVLGALGEFENIMNDLWHLMRKNVYHFKFVFDRRFTKEGEEWRVDVIGNETKFTAYVKPDTPLEKVVETILSNPDNVRSALAEAFTLLEGVASRLKSLLEFAKELQDLEKRIKHIEEVLEDVKEYCRKREDE